MSPREELNLRPTPYHGVALPLSYPGVIFEENYPKIPITRPKYKSVFRKRILYFGALLRKAVGWEGFAPPKAEATAFTARSI